MSFGKAPEDGWMGWKVLPIKVEMQGFRSDTLRLQQEGWQLSQDWRPDWQAMTMAFKHPRLKLFMMSHMMDDIHFQRTGESRQEMLEHMVIHIQMISPQIEVVREHIRDMDAVSHFGNFQAVDATPRLFSQHIERISDFNIFEPIPKSEDIIVRPDSVPELMDRILDLQEPKMKEILKRERNRSFHGDALGERDHKVETHAKIISIAS